MSDTVTAAEAVKIAVRWNSKIDTYQEYNDAYFFYIDDGEERIGGPDCGFAVLKQGGSILRWNEYFMDAGRECEETGEPVKLKKREIRKEVRQLDFDTVSFTMTADELTEAVDYCISVNKHFHDVFPLPDDYGDGVNMYG